MGSYDIWSGGSYYFNTAYFDFFVMKEPQEYHRSLKLR